MKSSALKPRLRAIWRKICDLPMPWGPRTRIAMSAGREGATVVKVAMSS
jgi:hypothetical protein